jgi:hypothetical protein
MPFKLELELSSSLPLYVGEGSSGLRMGSESPLTTGTRTLSESASLSLKPGARGVSGVVREGMTGTEVVSSGN